MERRKWLHEEENRLVHPEWTAGVATGQKPLLRYPSVPKKPAGTGITPKILLQHMQGMEGRLIQRIDGVENSLTTRMNRLEDKVDRIHISLSTQIDGIDHRMDDLEVVQVPKLKKAVGIR